MASEAPLPLALGPKETHLTSAALIVMGGFLGSRLLGLVRNAVIGEIFGTGPELDAYFAAFRLPDLLFQLLAGAALAGAFLPAFSRTLTRQGQAAAAHLAGALLTLTAGGTAALAALAFLFAPLLVPPTVPGFPPSLQQLTIALTRLMLVSPCFFSLSGLVTAVLQGQQRFLLPALAPWAYNGAIIVSALFLHEALGVPAMAWGVVAGSALHLAVQLPGLASSGLRLRLALGRGDPQVAEVLRLAGPRLLGLAAGQMNFFVTTALASLLTAGSLAALSYAWIVMMLPLGLFGMSLGTAIFPTLAEQAVEEDAEGLRQLLSSSLRLVLFLSIPAAAGLALLAPEVVAVLFQRGHFDASSVGLTASAVLGYAIGLPGHTALEVLARGFYAQRDTTTPFLLSAASLVLHLLFGLALMKPLGALGLAFALSSAALLEALAARVLLRRRLGWWPPGLLSSLGRTLLATAGMGIGLFFLRPMLAQAGPVVRLVAGVALGALLYGGLALLLRSQELRLLGRRGL